MIVSFSNWQQGPSQSRQQAEQHCFDPIRFFSTLLVLLMAQSECSSVPASLSAHLTRDDLRLFVSAAASSGFSFLCSCSAQEAGGVSQTSRGCLDSLS